MPFARVAAGVVAVFVSAVAVADEGMWTFDNPPRAQLKEHYGFEPTQAWLDHLRLSSVRFNTGGSGSFVSKDGLVLTNHHVARDQLQKVSSAEHDYASNGYLARTPGDEIKCPDLELNVLEAMENVTERIMSAVNAAGTDPVKQLTARKAEFAKIQKETKDATGKDCQVVTLYNGGEYWLYRYQKFTDVRVVFAPETSIAFYGGDHDNFTYPRFDLDMALFRAYVDEKPYRPAHWLEWNADGARAKDLVFVSGHPGSTARMKTLAQLEMMRDHDQPFALERLNRVRTALLNYGARGAEEVRQSSDLMFGVENSLKARIGQLQGLKDPAVMGKKAREEQEFRRHVAADPELSKQFGDAWDSIAGAEKTRLTRMPHSRFWSVGRSMSELVTIGVRIVQFVAEIKKPDGERLPGYHDSELESTRFALFSPAPVYTALEEALLADWFAYMKENVPSDDPFLAAVLQGKDPAAVARDLVSGTKLADPEVRKSLIEGGEAAVGASSDPMIALGRRIDVHLRELKKWTEDNVDSKTSTAGEKIGKARFAVYGKSVAPDATFTLRLSYGAVKGYAMNGTIAPPRTSTMGLFARSVEFDQKPPFEIPASWLNAKQELDMTTPFNFVCSTDIIGGNSGSPIIDSDGRLVGLVFDGNIESLVGDYVYDERLNRCVGVHAAIMIEALRKVYGAGDLADELVRKSDG